MAGGAPAGDAVLLMVLAASASYIAVPAVVRFAIPEADPSLYVSLSLGLDVSAEHRAGHPAVHAGGAGPLGCLAPNVIAALLFL